VGIALALAGAEVTLTDLPHVTPLTQLNVDSNCDPGRQRATVLDLRWGQPAPPAGAARLLPDMITAADVLYDEATHGDLLATIEQLSSPHTLTYIAYKKRAAAEEEFWDRAAAAGFAVQQLPPEALHAEFQDGSYVVLRLCKLG
jgi:hypothetical protein